MKDETQGKTRTQSRRWIQRFVRCLRFRRASTLPAPDSRACTTSLSVGDVSQFLRYTRDLETLNLRRMALLWNVALRNSRLPEFCRKNTFCIHLMAIGMTLLHSTHQWLGQFLERTMIPFREGFYRSRTGRDLLLSWGLRGRGLPGKLLPLSELILARFETSDSYCAQTPNDKS